MSFLSCVPLTQSAGRLSLVVLPLLLFPLHSSRADVGYFVDLNQSSGPIYGNSPDIRLKKEVLLCSDQSGRGHLEAHFIFENESNKPLEVEVGFPINFWSSAELKDGKVFTNNGAPIKWIVDVAGKAPLVMEYDEKDGQSYFLPDPTVLVVEKEIPITKGEEFVDRFEIEQDGSPVPPQKLFFKSRFDGHRIDGSLNYTLKLKFPAQKTTHVVVQYSQSALKETSDDKSFLELSYFLGTGGTWRGPIGDLFLVFPETWDLDLPPVLRGSPPVTLGERVIYRTSGYEPSNTDTIKMNWIDSSGEVEVLSLTEIPVGKTPSEPAQRFVSIRGASSSLKGTTKVFHFRRVSRGLDDSEARSVGFGPLSLFDGIPESAWCEGVPGEGRGEWIDFELTSPVRGMEIVNGFQKVSDRFVGIEDGPPSAPFDDNGRPRSIEIVSGDGKFSRQVELADIRTRQMFDVRLSPGVYRLKIKDIYKGRRWADTCMGEMSFLPEDDFLFSVLGQK